MSGGSKKSMYVFQTLNLPANLGKTLLFAHKKLEAVPIVPKIGTGSGWMIRVIACNI